MRRHKLSKGKSGSMFTRNANRVHPKNGLFSSIATSSMRGGVRF